MTTRRQKYPDTDVFHYYNANPKNRITGDCSFRAISTALNQDYNQTVMEMAELMCEIGYTLNDSKGENAYLASKGWVMHAQPKHFDNTKYTGKEFCQEFKGTCVAHLGRSHTVCIKDGKVWDTWNSTYRCIGNYWTKE